MTTAQASAVPQDPGSPPRFRNVAIAGSALLRFVRKIMRIRQNAASWLAFRVLLGFSGAALVILPLSLWNNWLAAPAGLCMFLTSILLPPAKQPAAAYFQPPVRVAVPKPEPSRAVPTPLVFTLNGGYFRAIDSDAIPVRLFIDLESIRAVDARSRQLLAIPIAQLGLAIVLPRRKHWVLQLCWTGGVAEFSYFGMLAEKHARSAQSAISPLVRNPLPVGQKSHAASAGSL
jgi:hypothetical protein